MEQIEKHSVHKGKQQIQFSKGNIQHKINEGTSQIDGINLKYEKLEKERKLLDDQHKDERDEELREEMQNSGKENAALEMKWAELKEIDECEELKAEIDAQQQSFQEIIDRKKELIKKYEDELKKRDEDYARTLKEQSEDITKLIGLMRSQFGELRERYELELEKIEEEFCSERDSVLKSAEDKLTELFNMHKELEKRYATENNDREEKQLRDIEELRIQGAKTYAENKIQFETEIQNLEKCLQDMHALYHLNQEKLDYNLKVLSEKESENINLITELKRKQQNLDTRLRTLKREHCQTDQKFKNENKSLTMEYKRITKQFSELQKKFKHFEKADLDKFNEIQKMNEEEVQRLKEKIIKADMTLHVQQLGIPWTSLEQMQQLNAEQGEGSKSGTQQFAKSTSQQQQTQEKSDTKKQTTQGKEEEEKTQQKTESQRAQQEAMLGQISFDDETLEALMDMLLEETDFLLDDKIRDQIRNAEPFDQKVIKLDTLKKCLQVNSVEEMNILFEEIHKKALHKFKPVYEQIKEEGEQEDEEQDEELKEQADEEKGKKTKKEVDKSVTRGIKEEDEGEEEDEEEEEEDEEQSQEDGQIYDIRNEIVETLQDFIKNKEERQKYLNEKLLSKKQIKQETEREKKERIARDGKKYWLRLTEVIPPQNFRIWKMLDVALSKYYQLLLDRQKLIEETGDLHNQNEELKNLLNQYLQINHELIIPPTRMIKLDQN